MNIRSIALAPLLFTASCADATPKTGAKPVMVQFALFHFSNDKVRITVNGKTAFDRIVTVAPDDAR